MKDKDCNIICDLIPLVKDGVASQESEDKVLEHIEDCSTCRKEFDTLESIDLAEPDMESEKIITAIRRNIFISQLVVLTLGAIIGLALTGSMGQFYNLVIMPIVGGLTALALKNRWYIGFIIVFILSYLGQILYFIFTNQFTWGVLYGSMFYGMIYISLMALGIVILRLLIFAFGKGGSGNEGE